MKSLSILGDNLNHAQFKRLVLDDIIYEFLDKGKLNGYIRYNSIFSGYVENFGLQAALIGSYDCFLYCENKEKAKEVLLEKSLDYGEQVNFIVTRTAARTLLSKTNTILLLSTEKNSEVIQIAKAAETKVLLFDYVEGKFVEI